MEDAVGVEGGADKVKVVGMEVVIGVVGVVDVVGMEAVVAVIGVAAVEAGNDTTLVFMRPC